MAPAMPAPTTAVGMDAPAEEDDDDASVADAADSVEELVSLSSDDDDDDDSLVAELVSSVVLEAVFVACERMELNWPPGKLVARGMRNCCTSVGSPVNQAGVDPSRNCEAMIIDAEGELVSARPTSDGGRAV